MCKKDKTGELYWNFSFKKALVGSCFPEENIWEDESDGTKGNETSEDCLEKDLITHCLHDEHIKEHFTEMIVSTHE